MTNYWVGKYQNGLLVLFDEEIYQDDKETVVLYVYPSSCIKRFNRINARNFVLTVKDDEIKSKVVTSYLSYISDLEDGIETINSELSSAKFADLTKEIEEDMSRSGYYRPNYKSPDYEYSDDDFEGLEGDYYLDDYSGVDYPEYDHD